MTKQILFFSGYNYYFLANMLKVISVFEKGKLPFNYLGLPC